MDDFPCPRCGSPRSLADYVLARCNHCGPRDLPPTRPATGDSPTQDPAVELNELDITLRQLSALRARGAIALSSLLLIRDAIEERQRQLLADERKEIPVSPPSEPIQPSTVEASLGYHWRVVSEESAAVPDTPEAPSLPPPLAVPAIPSPVPESAPILDVLEPEPPRVAPPPRRTLGEVLAAFMEDKNILWGELVGGLLIVGCSVALVISQWNHLARIPYFPFLAMAAVTAGLFSAGLYTLHHWKLESSSRGLLVISTLLVPLDFVVLAGLSLVWSGGPLGALVELSATVVFSFLVRRAGRVLTGNVRDGTWLMLAVLGPSAAQLLVPRLLSRGLDDVGLVVLLGLLPVACQGLGAFAVLRRAAQRSPFGTGVAGPLLIFMGAGAFATSTALCFLFWWSEAGALALHALALPAAAAGLLLFLGGLLIHRRLADPAEAREEHGGFRTAGTAVVLFGLGVMVAAPALAWPQPAALLAVCLFNFVALTVSASRGSFVVAHLPALACLTVATLTGYHLLFGPLDLWSASAPRLVLLALSPSSGALLVGLAVVLAGAAEAWARAGSTNELNVYAAACAVVAAVGLGISALATFEQAGQTALVFGTGSALGLGWNLRWRKPLLSHAGALILLAATSAAWIWADSDRDLTQLLALALLTQATALFGFSSLFTESIGGKAEPGAVWVRVHRTWTVASSALSLALLALALTRSAFVFSASAGFWIAALWTAVAWVERSPRLFTAAQVLFLPTVLVAVSEWVQTQGWPLASANGLRADAVGLAALSLVMTGIRLLFGFSQHFRELLPRSGRAADEAVLILLIPAFLFAELLRFSPIILGELLPTDLSDWVRVNWYLGGANRGAWITLSSLAAALLFSLWDERRVREILVGLVCLAIAVPVVAASGRQADAMAVSGLRWAAAATFLLVSVLIWLRRPLGRLASDLGISVPEEDEMLPVVRGLLEFGVLGLLLGATAAVVVSVSLFPGPGVVPASPLFVGLSPSSDAAVPLVLAAMGLAGYAFLERRPGHAFSAGLFLVGAVLIADVLNRFRAGLPLNTAACVSFLQQGTAVAAGWVFFWWLGDLADARWGTKRDGHPLAGLGLPTDGGGMWAQLLLTASGMSVILLGSVLAYLETPPVWAIEAGGPVSWAVLALVVGAHAVFWERRGVVKPGSAYLIGVAVIVLASCTVERLSPGAGRHVLVTAAGVYALGWSLFLREGGRRLWPVSELHVLPMALGWTGAGLGVAALLSLTTGQERPWVAASLAVFAAAAGRVAYRLRREEWALVAGLSLNVAATLVWCWTEAGEPLGAGWVGLVQVNTCVSAAVVVGWVLLARYRAPDVRASIGAGTLFRVPLLAALTGCSFLVLVAVHLLLFPAEPLTPAFLQAGQIPGWLAVSLTTLALLVGRAILRDLDLLMFSGLCLGVLAACSLSVTNARDWLSFHTLLGSWAALGPVLVLLGWATSESPSERTRVWLEALGAAVVLLALRGAVTDPGRPYWSAGALLTVAGTTTALARWARQPRRIYTAGMLFNLAGFLIWLSWLIDAKVPSSAWDWEGGIPQSLGFSQALCLSLAAIAAVLVERSLRQPEDSLPPYAGLANLLALSLMIGLVSGGLAFPLNSPFVSPTSLVAWAALVAMALSTLLTLLLLPNWGDPALNLYLTGLLGIGLALTNEPIARLAWMSAVALAWYGTIAAFIDSRCGETRHWFWPTQFLCGSVVVGMSLWLSLGFDVAAKRLAGVFAVAGLFTTALLATRPRGLEASLDGKGTDQQPMSPGAVSFARTLTVFLAVLFLVELGWLWVGPEALPLGIRTSVILLIALTLLGVSCSRSAEWLLREFPDWGETAEQCGPVLTLLASAVLLVFLPLEFRDYDPSVRCTPLPLPLVLLGVGVMLVLTVEMLRYAVRSGPDTVGLPEGNRAIYVYVAELILALLLIHMRLNVADVFPSFLGENWPLVLMAVAYLGAGVSEFLSQRGSSVLAGPLLQTGVCLPLLPLTALLVRDSAGFRSSLDAASTLLPGVQPFARYLDYLPVHYGTQSLLCFLLAALYGFVALAHRSMLFAVLSGLAANFALWVVWAHHENLSFYLHPQLWLIPLALILLTAEHLNRSRLTAGQSAALRYLGVTVIYAASAADMFIAGLGNSLWLPVVLAVLSVLGVLAGILLRVQAFLFQGLAFLILDVFAQVWFAAVDCEQAWVWWTSGIILGAAILGLFALFEKRRQDLLRLFEDLRTWD